MRTKRNQDKGSGSNIFELDRSYRQSPLLQFKNPRTELRFKSEHFQDFSSLLAISFALVFGLMIVPDFHLYFKISDVLIFTMLMATVIKLNSKLGNLYLAQATFHILIIHLQMLLLRTYSKEERQNLIISQIILLATNLTCSRNFLFSFLTNCLNHFVASRAMKGLYPEDVNDFTERFFFHSYIFSAIFWIAHYFCERKIRKLWIVKDSTKRSQKTFYNTVDEAALPLFVTDQNRQVLYSNKLAKELMMKSLNLTRLPRNFNLMSLFANDCQETLDEVYQKARYEKSAQLTLPVRSLGENEEEPHQIIESRKITISEAEELNQGSKKNFKESSISFDIIVKTVIWKNAICFSLTFIDQRNFREFMETSEQNYSALVTDCTALLDNFEADYIKWNNLQALKIIKESDLKILSKCVIDMVFLKNKIYLNQLNSRIAAKNRSKLANQVGFNIRNTIIYVMEVFSSQSIEKNIELHLKFEESFPDTVQGDYLEFESLLTVILRSLIVKPQVAPKNPKLNLDCKLLKYFNLSDRGKFVLQFNFSFPSSDSLNEKLSLLTKDEQLNDYDLNCLRHMMNDPQRHKSFLVLPDEENRACLSLEIPFETIDTSMLNPNDRGANKKQGVQLIVPKTLSLSFCRLSGNINTFFWKQRPPQQIIKPIIFEGGKTIIGRMEIPSKMHMTYQSKAILKKQMDKEKDEKKEKEELPTPSSNPNQTFQLNALVSEIPPSEPTPLINVSPKNPNIPSGIVVDLGKIPLDNNNSEKTSKGEETRRSGLEKIESMKNIKLEKFPSFTQGDFKRGERGSDMKASKDSLRKLEMSPPTSSNGSTYESELNEQSTLLKDKNTFGNGAEVKPRRFSKAKTQIPIDKAKFLTKMLDHKEKRVRSRYRTKKLSKGHERTNSYSNIEQSIEKFLQKKLEEIIEEKGPLYSDNPDENLITMLKDLFKVFEKEFQNILLNSLFQILNNLYGASSILIDSEKPQLNIQPVDKGKEKHSRISNLHKDRSPTHRKGRGGAPNDNTEAPEEDEEKGRTNPALNRILISPSIQYSLLQRSQPPDQLLRYSQSARRASVNLKPSPLIRRDTRSFPTEEEELEELDEAEESDVDDAVTRNIRAQDESRKIFLPFRDTIFEELPLSMRFRVYTDRRAWTLENKDVLLTKRISDGEEKTLQVLFIGSEVRVYTKIKSFDLRNLMARITYTYIDEGVKAIDLYRYYIERGTDFDVIVIDENIQSIKIDEICDEIGKINKFYNKTTPFSMILLLQKAKTIHTNEPLDNPDLGPSNRIYNHLPFDKQLEKPVDKFELEKGLSEHLDKKYAVVT